MKNILLSNLAKVNFNNWHRPFAVENCLDH